MRPAAPKPRRSRRATRTGSQGTSLSPPKRGEAALRYLLQLVLDLVEAGLDAGFILLATRRAGDAGRADHILADLDRQRATGGGVAGEILRAHRRVLLQPLLHLAGRNAEGAGCERLLPAVP